MKMLVASEKIMDKIGGVGVGNNRLSKNIKSLRTAYGETQLELALAIGLDSPNAIANYEKGDRNPKPEIRNKIAAHFRVTEDELVNTDFSQFQISSMRLNDKEYMTEVTLCIFPIIWSERAMQNEDFRKAYDAHQRAVEAMKSGKAFDDAGYDICFDSYSIAREKNELVEAAANILWWLLINEMCIKNPWVIEMAESLNQSSDKGSKLLKKYYLRDMSEESPNQLSSDISQRDMDDFEEEIIEIIKELKTTPELSDLADYYLALRYLMGCVRNELSDEMNRSVGSEMMWAFLQMGNKYARQYYKKCLENSKNKG